MTDRTDLDSILDADHSPEPMAPMVQEAQAQTPVTGDKTEGAEPPAATRLEPVEPPTVPRDALMDERRKRQELEKQLQSMQQQMQRPQQEEERPDWFADPEKASQYFRAEVERSNFATRIELSESIVEAQHQDYAQYRDVFAEAASQDPGLAQRLVQARNPAKFAYETGKRIALMREIGDNPDGYREKLRAEVMKELGMSGGEAPSAQKQLPPPSAPVPKSLARSPSAPVRAPNGQFLSNGPTPLSDILD